MLGFVYTPKSYMALCFLKKGLSLQLPDTPVEYFLACSHTDDKSGRRAGRSWDAVDCKIHVLANWWEKTMLQALRMNRSNDRGKTQMSRPFFIMGVII